MPRLLIDFFAQAYSYRHYLVQSVRRDLAKKYKRSSLGYVWTMLHPLAMMLIMSFVMSHVVRVQMKDYAVFFLAAVLPWNYFNSTSMMSLNSIRANAKLFSQIPIPKYLFILSISASNLVNFLLALVPLVLVMAITGKEISPTILFFPFLLLPLYIITISVAMLLAVSNIFFEDTLHLAEVGMQAMYFLLPIIYPPSMIPDRVSNILSLNPLFFQIQSIRNIFYLGEMPNLFFFFLNLGVALVVLFFALKIFKRAEDKLLYFI
ncbi:MAG TPA: ABC transporter permease [Oligoflexia bacterium]|nr:ABC transporter permease [Oligoflexia bacterium]HMP27042.1 ABC transporter permease [Oligoflexia bacterium]